MKPYKRGIAFGVFDLFHIGHLNLLRNAKSMCDYLIVGVTDDKLVEYKGKKSVIPYEERVQIVRHCDFVDLAIPQADMDKAEKIKMLGIDVVFVGSDWYGTDKWKKYEADFREASCDIVYFPYTEGTSSTLLNETLLRLRDKGNKIPHHKTSDISVSYVYDDNSNIHFTEASWVPKHER